MEGALVEFLIVFAKFIQLSKRGSLFAILAAGYVIPSVKWVLNWFHGRRNQEEYGQIYG